MKTLQCALLVLGSLLLPAAVLADDTMPTAETVGDVTFVSGGIGKLEAKAMRDSAKDYALEIAFVLKFKQHEEFIADVTVEIEDVKRNIVLTTVTEGPYLFVNLPQGKYVVKAEFNGVSKHQVVRVNAKKHQKLVFWWPLAGSDATQIEAQIETDKASNIEAENTPEMLEEDEAETTTE
jgi:hypothetical protein